MWSEDDRDVRCALEACDNVMVHQGASGIVCISTKIDLTWEILTSFKHDSIWSDGFGCVQVILCFERATVYSGVVDDRG